MFHAIVDNGINSEDYLKLQSKDDENDNIYD